MNVTSKAKSVTDIGKYVTNTLKNVTRYVCTYKILQQKNATPHGQRLLSNMEQIRAT